MIHELRRPEDVFGITKEIKLEERFRKIVYG